MWSAKEYEIMKWRCLMQRKKKLIRNMLIIIHNDVIIKNLPFSKSHLKMKLAQSKSCTDKLCSFYILAFIVPEQSLNFIKLEKKTASDFKHETHLSLFYTRQKFIRQVILNNIHSHIIKQTHTTCFSRELRVLRLYDILFEW